MHATNTAAIGTSQRTVSGSLAEQSTSLRDRPYVQLDGRITSYPEVSAAVLRVAIGLASTGVAAGDRVCIALPNCLDVLIASFSVRRDIKVMDVLPETPTGQGTQRRFTRTAGHLEPTGSRGREYLSAVVAARHGNQNDG
jgi:acyl-CoA synthetase (AMP-forming)/AMP-acid ligase II